MTVPYAEDPCFATPYGAFAPEGGEYVITTPETPRPWINYLTNGAYCALCSQVGGGFSFYQDHRYNAILRRSDNQYLADLPARLWYVKDEETGELWTANVHPLGKYDHFTARHGMGYTAVTSGYREIDASMRYFVPPGIDAELWELDLVNTGDRPRTLSVYSYADFQLGNVTLDQHETFFIGLFNDAEVAEGTAILVKKWWHPQYGWSEENGIWQHRVFLTTAVAPTRLLLNRDVFFGAGRGYDRPRALEAAVLPEAPVSGKMLAGVYQWRITLAPGAGWGTKLAIGIQPNADTAENRQVIASLRQPETYAAAWERTRAQWGGLLGRVAVQTPDPAINLMANYWNKYQALINCYFGRGPSYYHKGQYQGMRDSCQDAFGVIALNPELAKASIRRIAHFFFSDGRCGGGCNLIGLPEGAADKADLPLWLILAVADYLRETGDFAFLDDVIPLIDTGASTIYQKMIAGVDRMFEERGARGLPLIGKGDWNDAANAIGAKGQGESVWLGQFLFFVIHELLPIMERRGDTGKMAAYRRRAEEIRAIVNAECWDGEWFVRAFKDDGSPVGVKGQAEGCIWINSQTWAVIAGISDPERLNTCMDSAERYLGTTYGMMNLGPAFTQVDESIGLITRFPRGWKENAAVFSHASAFNVVARAMLGRGADAVDLFRRILPVGKDPDHYLMEPYVFSQFSVGPGYPEEFGRGAYHWLTGTAAWMFRALIDYIIGVHPLYDGLRIDPAIDPSWTQFSLRRAFRGATYHIEFLNPDGVEHGVREIRLDGRPIAGNVLPLPTAAEHRVTVVMGRA